MSEGNYYPRVKESRRSTYSNENQHRLKPYKLVVLFAVVSVLVFGGLACWGTVVVVKKVASSLNAETIRLSLQTRQEEFKAFLYRPITTKECVDSMLRMTPARLLNDPIAKNIEVIRSICWNNLKTQENIDEQS